jgi:hypothetical protein
MEEVLHNPSTQVPLWSAALQAHADWSAIYKGYGSAVDWPTARFFRELSTAYPSARFILTTRSPESWASSFSETIYKFIAEPDRIPAELQPWTEMCIDVIAQSGFPSGLDTASLMKGFVAHNEAVKAAIPADRLLVFQVQEGWGPLCDFLGVRAPSDPFPRTNDRAEFWEIVSGKKK